MHQLENSSTRSVHVELQAIVFYFALGQLNLGLFRGDVLMIFDESEIRIFFPQMTFFLEKHIFAPH